MSQQQDKGQDGARREASSVPRSPRPADTGMSPRNRRRKPHFGGAQLQIQTLESAATAAEGDAQDTARASDLPPQSPRTGGSQHPPKSPRSKPYRARGSRGRGGRRRRAAQKQAEAEAAAAALLGLPSSESPRSMTSANDEDSLSLYSDAADAASCLSSPMASPLHVHVGRPSSRHIQHEAEAQETQESALQRQRQHQATSQQLPSPLSPFHQQLEGLSQAASQAAAQAAVTSSEIFDPPKIQRKMDAMAASAARTASTWSSTIDRPMETIEILTDRLCPVRHDPTADDVYNSTDATAFPPPGLQRLRSFSSELSVTSTFDSPRGRAGTDASFHSESHPPRYASGDQTVPSTAAGASKLVASTTSMPRIAEDLKGLALIDEDKDLNIVRTDTHITSMSTASTNFGGANSSQMTQQYSVSSASVVTSSSPGVYARPLASAEDRYAAAPSPRSRTSSCEYSEYSTASTQAILDGHPGVLPPSMPTTSHGKGNHQQYESRFLAGGYGGKGGDGVKCWDDDEHGDVYSFSDESSMQPNGYFFRESVTPRCTGLSPPSSASKISDRHTTVGRERTFTDPTHAAMGFSQPSPIPFAAGQIEEAKKAALREQMDQSQEYHHSIRGASTFAQQESHMVETKKHQAYPSGDNMGRILGETIAGGEEVLVREKAVPKSDEIDSVISQDDGASLFNTSPKSFLMGQQSGSGGSGGGSGSGGDGDGDGDGGKE